MMTSVPSPPAMQSQRVFATSNPYQITFVLDAIIQLAPRSVLDIGCGSGKYGVLVREYLRGARIEAIEGFPAYITAVHRAVYDEIHLGNAAEVVPSLDRRYDLATLIDVFEHLTPADGAWLLDRLSERSKSILISVPANHHEQDALEGNELQVHRAHYGPGSLRKLGFHQVWRVAGSYLALRGEGRIKYRGQVLRLASTLLAPNWMSRGLAPLVHRLGVGGPAHLR